MIFWARAINIMAALGGLASYAAKYLFHVPNTGGLQAVLWPLLLFSGCVFFYLRDRQGKDERLQTADRRIQEVDR